MKKITTVMKKYKQNLTGEISEQIWKHVWENADNKDTDEDLCNEHTNFCKRYQNGEYLKFINQ